MIRTAVTNSAKREFLQGIHQPGDVYKIALYSFKANLDAGTGEYTPANEIGSIGYKAGGQALSGYADSLDAGTAIMSFKTIAWEGASISARGAMIYNSSKGNKAVAVFDFGAEITSTNGKFTATMPAATAATGLICLE